LQPAQSKEEEEFRKLNLEMRYLEQTAETLQQRVGMVNAALTDLTYANMTIEGIEKEKENTELLVPTGGGSYVKAKLVNPDKVIISVGAGVSMEKPLPEAKVILKERMAELEKTRNSAQQQFTQIAERIAMGRTRMDSLLVTLRQGKAPGNV
jgi:prefoldin alpha subunit